MYVRIIYGIVTNWMLADGIAIDRTFLNGMLTNCKFSKNNIWNFQELEKLASRKLHINAKETMRIAEKLYTQGFISYPRTETNIFPKELDLHPLVEMQAQDPNWGGKCVQTVKLFVVG